MAVSDSLKSAQKRYNEKRKAVTFYLIKGQDDDVIEALNASQNKTDYIRSLIRADIRKQA